MTQLFKIPAYEIDHRIARIQDQLQEADVKALLIVQRVDLLYFSGTAQNGFLFIPAQGPPLLLVRRYMPRARQESSIRDMLEITSPTEVPGRIADFYGGIPRTVGFELDVVPVNEFAFYCRLFPEQDCVDGSPFIHKTRSIKSPWELNQMEKTARISFRTFEYMRDHIRPGYTEMEFGGMCEAFARKIGHGGRLRVRDYQTEGYPWHILSGVSGGMVGLLDSPASGQGTSAAFPVGAGIRKFLPDEPIMIDWSTVFNGFHMDETRMFATGSMPKEALDASLAAIDIHNTVLDNVRPGIPVKELFHIALARAKKVGYAEPYLGPPGYKVQFIGHGIGHELIEQPILSAKDETLLEPGMTFALEPKMVFKNRFSAGIESVFTVTENGHRLISEIPVEVFICSR
ncbi:MAG: aminopeptidase P family protein [Deltaproteobacteria bacterium]|nr:aminopeptidase P family protein [Deltaproteobacteria bacterium]